MTKKTTIAILIFLSIAVGFSLGRFVYKSENIFYAHNDDFQNLKSLIEIIEENYSDQINVFDFLKNSLLEKMKTIDPYLTFYDADEYDQVKNNINGEYEGIGIKYFMYNDTVIISGIFKNSPADIAGLKKLDKITSLNNNNLTDIKIDSVITLFSETKNYNLSVINFFTGKTNNIVLKPEKIQKNPIKHFYAGNNTGYISISEFQTNTFDFFKDAEKDLLSRYKIDNIILDLRDNPGGLLSSAVNILDEFFPQGDTLTITETKEAEKEFYISTSEGLLKDVQVIILINGSSASAAELVSLAMQDNDRALILGSQSYGKGVFQQDMSVDDGNVVHVTRGKYFGPSGRWIDTQSNKYSNFTYYQTKGGRNVAAENAIVPDKYIHSNINSYLNYIFDEYCLEFLFNNKSIFKNATTREKIISIATSIVDTGGVKIYNEYFENDTIMTKTLAYSFAKYLLPDTAYFHFTRETDSIFINAINIFKNKDIKTEIFRNDTLKPFTFLME